MEKVNIGVAKMDNGYCADCELLLLVSIKTIESLCLKELNVKLALCFILNTEAQRHREFKWREK